LVLCEAPLQDRRAREDEPDGEALPEARMEALADMVFAPPRIRHPRYFALSCKLIGLLSG
jgi:hypothetical protein